MNRKTAANIVTGTILIIVGIYILGQMAGFWGSILLLGGWWTLFLILPAISGIIVTGPRVHNIFLLLLGMWLYLNSLGLLGERAWTFLLGAFFVSLSVCHIAGRAHGGRRHHRHESDEPVRDPLGENVR